MSDKERDELADNFHRIVAEIEDLATEEPDIATEEVVMPARERRMTKEGLEYTVQTKFKRLESLSRTLSKHITSTYDAIAQNDQELVKNCYIKWVKIYDEFLEVDRDYRQLLSKSQVEI